METKGSDPMLHAALAFLVLAFIAAILGFGGITGGAAAVFQVTFVVFLVLFLASLLTGVVRRPETFDDE